MQPLDPKKELSRSNLLPQLWAVIGPDGRFLEASAPLSQILGFSNLELLDLPLFDLVHPEDLSRTQIEIHKLMKAGQGATFDHRLRRKDSSDQWIRWSGTYVPEEGRYYLTGSDISPLKSAEKALEESRVKFNRMNESTTEGIAIHDKGVVLEANRALARIFGFDKAEEMVGKNGLDLTAPEFRQLILNNILSGYEEPYEVVGLRKDGTRFDCLISGRPIQYEGRMVRVSTFLDITKMKKREQELFESQELFRKLAEASKDGIAVSEKGNVLMANPALAKIFGTTVAEMLGRNALEFAAPEFRETLLKNVLEEVETPYEVIGLRRDGSRVPLEITARMTSYQGRKVRVAFFRDITQRKQIEEEVLRQKEFSQNLINSSADGLLAFDPECRYTLWNPAMERISGHSREEVLGQVAFDVFPFLKQIGEDRHFYGALDGKTSFAQERPYRTPAGRQGFFEANYMPIKNAKGQIIGGLGVIRDITERKRTQEALRQSEINLRAVFNNTFQNITLLDREGRIQAFNANAAATFRNRMGKVLEVGRQLSEYIPDENLRSHQKWFLKALQGEAVKFEQRSFMSEGRDQWMEVGYNPVFGDRGDIEGVCLVSTNIDDRKGSEAAVQKSEADLRAIFNSSHQSIILVGRDGKIRDFNQNAKLKLTDTLGLSLEVDRPLADYVEPEYQKPFLERLKRVFKGEVLRLERTVRRKEGGEEWFEFTYNPVFDNHGKVTGACVAVTSIDERKRSEKALQESEEKFRKIFEETSFGMTLVDQSFRFVHVNRAFSKMLGYSQEGLIGKTFAEITHPEDVARNQALAKDLLNGQGFQMQKRYLHKNGSVVWANLTVNSLFDSEGHFLNSIGMIENITPQKAAQDALQKSEADLRAVFNNVAQDVILIASDGTIQSFNRSVQRSFEMANGMRLEIGRPFKDFVLPDLQEAFQKRFDRALAGEKVWLEASYRLQDGREHWFEYGYNPVLDDDGKIIGVCFVSQNIDERKRSERLLKESEEKFRKIFEDASMAMAMAMAMINDFKFLKVNRAFQELLGYSDGELVGKTLFEITFPEDMDRTKVIAHQLHRQERDNFQTEKRYLRKDGQYIWAHVSGTLIRDSSGQKLYSLILIENITDRKQAQEALRKSEADLRAVFNSGSQVTVLIGRDGKIEGYNKSAEIMAVRILGKKMEKGILFSSTLPPGASQEIYQTSFKAAMEGKETRGERAIRSADGQERWVEVKYQPVLEDQGSVVGVCFSLTFIDDRKKAEEALKESQERFELLVQVTREGVLVHSNAKVEDANPALAEMLGYTHEEMLEKTGFDLLSPESHEVARRNMNDESQAPYEALALRKDGSTFPVELQGRNYHFKGRKLRVLSVRDLTWRKEAEKILTESEDRYRRLVELSPEAILVHSEGKILYVNPAGLNLFGAKAEDLAGHSIQDFLNPESKAMVLNRVRQIMEKGEPVEWVEQKLRRLNGEEFHAETKGTPFLYRGIPSVLTILRDITERKRTQQTLLRYERLAAIGKVIAAIAHEVRNPLAVLSGMSQILTSKLESRKEYSQELKTILAQADRLKYFMNDILDYSREMEIRKTQINPRTLLEDSLVVAQSQIGPKHDAIELHWALEGNLPYFWGDSGRLEQVLTNLIVNAYQAVGDQGNLDIFARVSGDKIRLGVADNGQGISEADMPRLFDPFFTTKKNGSGLGLSISQKIAEAHGGRIEVRRLQPHGTEFVLEIPMGQEP